MKLQTSIKPDFLDLFYKELECKVGGTNSKLNLHILRIENNRFCYPELIKSLSNALLSFALSKKEFSEFESSQRYGEMNTRALEKFRDYKENEGEAGELLLFCFLEAHLNAPKILTKLEIKLSGNDYAKGSDGVHLLEISERKYQLIFGESKLDDSLTQSISKAFKSISDFITRTKDNAKSEEALINSELFKEAFDEELYNYLKSVIFPKAAGPDPITKDNAFGIFAGFDLKLSDEDKEMDNDKFRNIVRERIKKEVLSKMDHIRNKIKEHKLYGYTFYIYACPFMELSAKRKEIIEKLTKGVS